MVLFFIFRVLVTLAGVAIVISTIRSAIQTFILPRGVSDPTARFVFLAVRGVFDLATSRRKTYDGRDHVMALFGPVALVSLTVSWLGLVIVGYTLIYWGLGFSTLGKCLLLSGSSIFTLGFVAVMSLRIGVLVFSEAGIGLLLAALLISYLPAIYNAWSRRELAVATLEVRAGSPPTAWDLIIRHHRIQGLDAANELWPTWEAWFLDIEESHTSLSSIVFFRSPQAHRSWVNAAGVILDSAAFFSAVLDVPRNPRRELCLRAGYIALRRIAKLFRIPFNPNPAPDDQISVTREEFDDVCRLLADSQVPLKPDLEQAWRDFSGWRVNYDEVLLSLAALTVAPYAPWISDRYSNWQHPLGTYWHNWVEFLRPQQDSSE